MIENAAIENPRAACALKTEDFYYDLPKEDALILTRYFDKEDGV